MATPVGWCLLAMGMLLALVDADVRESFHTSPPPIASGFSCANRRQGFYADESTNCRAYHTCDDHGNHFTHYCPEDTAFRQDAMICDHAYLVDCRANIESATSASERLERLSHLRTDANHDAPPASFAEPRGEGTNHRASAGFTRSYRVNPDLGNSARHPVFVLDSSVYLANRGATRPASATTTSTTTQSSFTQAEHEFTRTQSTFDSSSDYHFNENSSPEFVPTSNLPTLSDELQPPPEPSRVSKVISDFDNDEFSFLVPPPIRDDNVNQQRESSSFESLRSDSSRSIEPSRTANHAQDNSEKDKSLEAVTFSPRTKMILEMMKARGLGEQSSFDFDLPKPKNILEPPFLRSNFPASSRSNFNFRGDDYPYVETLRSIQNGHSSSSPFPRSTTVAGSSSTTTETPQEALILPVPSKPLLSGSDLDQDPYYPKDSTSTETYFTTRNQPIKSGKPFFTTMRPLQNKAKFEIPAVLPDLNSLEDLLDRRKFFFIPRVKSV